MAAGVHQALALHPAQWQLLQPVLLAGQLIELLQAHQILLVVRLQPQPEAGVMAQHPLQPFGAVGRDRRPALEQFIYMLGAEIQSLGQLGAGPAALLQDLLNQIPGRRGPVGIEAGETWNQFCCAAPWPTASPSRPTRIRPSCKAWV
jgi:hypothetical protein